MTPMPITGHLRELRGRLIASGVALLVCWATAFSFADRIRGSLGRTLEVPLVFLSPEEVLWSDLKVSLFVGFLMSLPVILYQGWRFVAPGLLPAERRAYFPFLLLSALFFLIGIGFAYGVAIPFALRFLIDYGRQNGVTPQLSISMYVDFHLKFLIAFGLVFELPVAMMLVSRTGLLTPAFLAHNRKYAVLLAFLIAALLTPTPDIFNQCLMAVPLILLYEAGILAIRIFGKKPTF